MGSRVGACSRLLVREQLPGREHPLRFLDGFVGNGQMDLHGVAVVVGVEAFFPDGVHTQVLP